MDGFVKQITARDMLKLQSCAALQGLLPGALFTKAQRLAQARFARSVRNCFFTATQPVPTTLIAPLTPGFPAQTPQFSDPIIITDLLGMTDYQQTNNAGFNIPRFLVRLNEIGAASDYGRDFFGISGIGGLGGFAPQEYVLKHEKNRGQLIDSNVLGVRLPDTEDKWLGFIPRLLKPFEYLQLQWRLVLGEPTFDANAAITPQLGARGIRVLSDDNPYAMLDADAETDLARYLSRALAPETYYLTIKIPFANFPALGAPPLTVQTDPSDRPLLVLGSACNIEGAQADLYDDSVYYQFTTIDNKNVGKNNTVYVAPPLALWCPDTDFRNVGMFNMWPVPHLLTRNSVLRIVVTNGLQPNAATPFVFQQPIATRSSQQGYITFICRTV